MAAHPQWGHRLAGARGDDRFLQAAADAMGPRSRRATRHHRSPTSSGCGKRSKEIAELVQGRREVVSRSRRAPARATERYAYGSRARQDSGVEEVVGTVERTSRCGRHRERARRISGPQIKGAGDSRKRAQSDIRNVRVHVTRLPADHVADPCSERELIFAPPTESAATARNRPPELVMVGTATRCWRWSEPREETTGVDGPCLSH